MTAGNWTILAILAAGASALLSDSPPGASQPASSQSASTASTQPASVQTRPASQPTSQSTWNMSDVVPGGLLAGFYVNIPMDSVDDLKKSPAFRLPADETVRLENFTLTDNPGIDYGTLVRGYIIPPADGRYVFFISSDDASELLLGDGEDPKGKKIIASLDTWSGPGEWNKYPSQTSKPVSLAANRRYYVEVLHKQGRGPSHLAVGWQLPDGTLERPIPGKRLAAPLPIAPIATSITFPATRPAAEHGMHKYFRAVDAKGPKFSFTMSYLLFLPKGYEASPKPVPMLVYLHGNTHQGENLDGILNEGPAHRLAENRELREWFPFLALFPQLPPERRFETRGSAIAIAELIRHVARTYRVDSDRIYLTGLSMGGQGTWHLAMESPELFAAIAPISAPAVNPELAAERLKMPVWIICGGSDDWYTKGSRQMRDALISAGTTVKFTEHPGEGHGVWDHCYPDRKFYEWFLENRRGQPASRIATQPASRSASQPASAATRQSQ
ncbi:MAG: dienelactone hydrolase family protein [Planctomycetes bacterium]|nr:dienelactone hydrolase family protein [Planctomycetota bacterium]